MKKFKFILLAATMIVGLSTVSASTENTTTSTICTDYSIKCDAGSFYGEVCGNTAEELVDKAWAISEIVCR